MNRIREVIVAYKPIGLCAGGILWLVWLINVSFGPGHLDLNDRVIGPDHAAFYTAATLIGHGRGEAIYDFPELSEFQREQEAIVGKPGFLDPYRNPPFYAIPYQATSNLPFLASYAIWAAIGLACLIGALALVRGKRIGRPLVWSLSFAPVFAAVSFGQNSLMSVAVFALVYRSLIANSRFLAGLAASLFLFKPQLLLGLGVWWLIDIRRYWQSLIGIAVGGGVLTIVSIAYVPGESRMWFERLPEIAKYDKFDFYNLHNLSGFGHLLTGSKTVAAAFGVVGLFVGIAWLVRFRRRHRGDDPLMFAAAAIVTLWASPHTLIYEWSIVILPALIFWDRRPEWRDRWLPWFGMAWIALFISTPLTKVQLDAFGIAVQISVPVLFFVTWKIDQLLASSER